jgi:hypothetical protein
MLVGISTWCSHLLSNRLISGWRHEEKVQLEGLKSSIANDRLVLESAIKSFESGQNLYQEKRLVAVEVLWEGVLRLRDRFSSPVFFFTVLAPNEYNDALKRGGAMSDVIEQISDSLSTDAVKEVEAVEKARPHLGETLWSQFFIYRAFLGRLHFLIVKAKKNTRFDGDWRDDRGIQQLLRAVLTADEVDGLLKRQAGFLLIQTVVSSLESVMLKEISLITSGNRSSFESFENAAQLRKAIAALAPPSVPEVSA